MSNGVDILTSMNVDELEALADAKLATSSQARLDQLLAKIDQLTILKTRARYTLKQQSEATQQ